MTKLIVISSETDIENETGLLNDLFAEGLGLFHLRKPDWRSVQQRFFLERIDPAFLSRISVHQHYETISEFGLKYLHVRSALAKSKADPEQADGVICSTSFHSYNEVQFGSHLWNYCFLSPVFDSISKINYKSTFSKDLFIENELYQRVFALGGITKNNIEQILEKGFYGAAVLGSIWKEPKKAVQHFKELDKVITTQKQDVRSSACLSGRQVVETK